MADSSELISKLSGQTKASIIVMEFILGNLELSKLKQLLDLLVSTDLERIGILELIRQQTEARALPEEQRNLLLGGLSVASPPPPPPLAPSAPRKTISVMPVKRKTSTVPKPHTVNPPSPPSLIPGGGTRRSAREPNFTKKIMRSSKIHRKNKGDTFFGSTVGGLSKFNEIEDKKAKVLLADDDPRIRMIFRMKLQNAGYCILEAGNGDDAWKIIESQNPDGIVMDMKMPGLHGLELLARLTSAGKHTPVCVCSAYDQLQDEFVVSNYPLLRYFVKPVDADALLSALQELLPLK